MLAVQCTIPLNSYVIIPTNMYRGNNNMCNDNMHSCIMLWTLKQLHALL